MQKPQWEAYHNWKMSQLPSDEQKCKNCKEEKLNIVAEYFKKYNKTLNKPRIDKKKLLKLIRDIGAPVGLPLSLSEELVKIIVKRKKEWLK